MTPAERQKAIVAHLGIKNGQYTEQMSELIETINCALWDAKECEPGEHIMMLTELQIQIASMLKERILKP